MSIEIGSTAPDFELEATDGTLFHLGDEVKKKPVLVNFYVGDFGIRCTDYMTVFNERVEEITALGITVVGVNDNAMDSHKKFKSRLALKWELLEDQGKKVATQYGCLVGPGHMTTGFTNREIYFVDADMKVLYKWKADVPKDLPVFDAVLDGVRNYL